MSSPYGPSGGNDPQQWGQQPQQPYGGGPYPGTPSGGFPAQQGGYGQPGQPGQQPQYGGYPQQDPAGGYGQPQQPTQQYPAGGYGQPDPASGAFPAQSPYGQQQPYGGYGGYPGQQPPKKKSSAVIWIAVVAVVLVAAAVGVLGFVTPGFFNKKVLDANAVQQGVTKILKEKYGEEATDVKCPADQPVETGHTFDCELKVDGDSRKVTITVKSEDKAEYEVSQSK